MDIHTDEFFGSPGCTPFSLKSKLNNLSEFDVLGDCLEKSLCSGAESLLRANQFSACLKTNGVFPLDSKKSHLYLLAAPIDTSREVMILFQMIPAFLTALGVLELG